PDYLYARRPPIGHSSGDDVVLAVKRADVSAPSRAPQRSARVARAVAADQLAQALVVLAAGGAALEVRAHPGHPGLGVLTGELELDVLVEALEALLAADLRTL